MRVPRPMICLNSVIESMRRSSTIRWQVWASTPVVISCEVLAMTGIGGFGVDEVVELGLALVVVAGDAHDVLAVGGGEVGIGVDQGLPHALGVVDVLAEDDGLGEAVGGLEELGDLGGDEFGALFEDQVAVEVAVVVFAVLDDLAVLVGLARLRAASRRGPCRGRCGRPCRERGSRRRCPAAASRCRSGRRSTRCWRRPWFPSAWRSGRSGWPRRSIRAPCARRHRRRRCRDGTRRR